MTPLFIFIPYYITYIKLFNNKTQLNCVKLCENIHKRKWLHKAIGSQNGFTRPITGGSILKRHLTASQSHRTDPQPVYSKTTSQSCTSILPHQQKKRNHLMISLTLKILNPLKTLIVLLYIQM